MDKICACCKRELPLESFGKNKQKKDGKYSYCRKCCAEKYKTYLQKNPGMKKKQGYKLHRCKSADLKRRHNLSVKEYDEILFFQGGVCKICANPPNGTALAVDHNHFTGKIRGLLCRDCNLGLGKFHDNILLMEKGLGYLMEDGYGLFTSNQSSPPASVSKDKEIKD